MGNLNAPALENNTNLVALEWSELVIDAIRKEGITSLTNAKELDATALIKLENTYRPKTQEPVFNPGQPKERTNSAALFNEPIKQLETENEMNTVAHGW